MPDVPGRHRPFLHTCSAKRPMSNARTGDVLSPTPLCMHTGPTATHATQGLTAQGICTTSKMHACHMGLTATHAHEGSYSARHLHERQDARMPRGAYCNACPRRVLQRKASARQARCTHATYDNCNGCPRKVLQREASAHRQDARMPHGTYCHACPRRVLQRKASAVRQDARTVSYTHLTLPTIYSV